MKLETIEDEEQKKTDFPWPKPSSELMNDPKIAYCGIGCWRPSCLEPMRDIRAFIAAVCFVSCLQASFSGYTSSQITTLERRFAIGSIVIGSVNSFFEVGYISCVMIVSYLGSKGRIPLWISCGLFAMSFGAFLFSTSQFLFPFDVNFSSDKDKHLCPNPILGNQSVSSDPPCQDQASSGYHFLPILMCAQFLIGAGSSPILTLAPPFVDDHVPPSKAPGMIASLYAAAALGPVFGYALGAFMLQHPMDKWSKTKILSATLTPASEDWIGLWWAGYIILGSGVLLGACILITFPRTLRSSFTPQKRSLEADLADRSSIDGRELNFNDSNLSDLPLNTTPASTYQVPLSRTPTSHWPYQQRASYQQHQRSFSGNVPYTVSPIINNIGTPQSVFFSMTRPRHQRSASASSVFLHAAIIAATASHAAVEEEDEAVVSTEVELSESSNESDGSLSTPEKSLNTRRDRLDQPTHSDSHYSTELFASPFQRRSSLSAQAQRRLISFFQVPRASIDVVPPGVTRTRRRTTSSRGISPPTLDAMMEYNTPDGPSTPIKKVTKIVGENAADAKSPTPLKPQDSADGVFNHQADDSSRSQHPTASSLANSSVFVQVPKRHKKRGRKIIRGRIFGFLADWSKNIPQSIFALLKNKIYTVTCLCICFEMFVVIGFAGFLPKYLEIEYQISKSTASMIAGGLVVPSGAIGILAGGLILNKAHFGEKGAVIFVLCVNFVIVSCMSSFFFLGCENPHIAGLTVPYPLGPFTEVGSVNASSAVVVRPWDMDCSRSCGCSRTVWKPVCHAKSNVVFFSPCYAGCTQGPNLLHGTHQFIYQHCHCLRSFAVDANEEYVSLRDKYAASNTGHPPAILDDEVQAGTCSPGCKTLIPFVCFLTVLLFLTGVIQNPLLMVTMRSVRHGQRSLALGLQFVIIRLLANIPSPIAFGHVIDGACLLWKTDCGRRGDCAFMDLRHLTQYITGFGVTVKCSSVLVYLVLIYLLSRRSSDSRNPLSTQSQAPQKEKDEEKL